MSKMLLIKISEIPYFKKYNISVVRGHYIINDCTPECFYYKNGAYSCKGCTCDEVQQHTWLLFIDKVSKEESVIDYTHYQFHEDFVDLESFLLKQNNSAIKIFIEMSKYTDFVDIFPKYCYLGYKINTLKSLKNQMEYGKILVPIYNEIFKK